MARRNRYLLFLDTPHKIACVLPNAHALRTVERREKKVVFKFSKTKNRRVFIVKSQNVVDQANSNPNNTNLTLSRRHINFFSSKLTEGNKTHTLFLTRYRHIH